MSTQREVPADTQKIFDIHPDFVTLWQIVGWVGVSLGAIFLAVVLIYMRAGSGIHRSISPSTSRRSMS
ncbi:hypothetical protein [Streptomyces sp. 5-10]|uniref:hypothetical protein n=1 Tax=Streptomyces sp. 5-10 TaxID=878925 RepID=UPI00168B1007|nr:hypothetical protein [Streptomyces sp. 5-10]MBD3004552.1 hypothetical protein [Streptomyces sp. 5-10]